MVNKYSYTKEKLGVTIKALATSPDHVRKRLCKSYIIFVTLTEKDFPIELRDDWKWIVKELNRYNPMYNINGDIIMGSVENTMRRVRNSTGVKIAERIYNVYTKLKNDY